MLKTQASLQERLESRTLTAERVDYVRARLDEWGLEHVREEREDAVQRLELWVLVVAHFTVGNASEELGEDGQVEDERGSEKRVLKIERKVSITVEETSRIRMNVPRTR